MKFSIIIPAFILFLAVCLKECTSLNPPERPSSGPILQDARNSIQRYRKSGNPAECSELATKTEALIVQVEAEEKYSKYVDYENNKKDKEIQELKDEIAKLKDELSTWRTIKYGAIASFVLYILALIAGWYLKEIGLSGISGLLSRFKPEK